MKFHLSLKKMAAPLIALSLLNSITVSADQPKVEYLPINGMIVAEKDGLVKIASANGRFEFRGTLIDRWSDQQILTLEDARHSMNHIKLDGINMNQDEALAPYKFGTGPKNIMVFIDPNCPACGLLMDEIPENSTEYTFNVIPVGLLGDQSRNIVSGLTCAKDQAAAKKQIKTKTFSPLAQDEGCALDLITRRMFTAQLLNVNGLPFMIRDDGLISRGFPKLGLEAWLKG